ncbi:MAG: cytochrome c biogenesis protein [Glaciecola sp.]|jgi:cytochrome c biogenesis protein
MSRIDSFDPPEANPEPRRPSGPDLAARGPGRIVLDAALIFWRWLRRMRTALYLLGVLSVMTLVATIVPQEPNVGLTVAAWRAGEEGPGTIVSGFLDAIGAYDTYGSPAFLVILVLLFTSLTACLLPRYRAWWRITTQTRPPRVRELDGQEHVQRFASSESPEQVLASARGLLGSKRWRLRVESDEELAALEAKTARPVAGQVAAEKGMVLREGGSLVFHTSFYVLLIGVILGQLFGFSGQVGIVEGETFAETAVGYWSYTPGGMWSDEDHRGFSLSVDEFIVDWYRDVVRGGTPKTFLVDVEIAKPDGTSYTERIGGNDPAVVDGMKIHLLDWGYAPRVQVLVDDTLVYDGFVTMSPTNRGFWSGAVKAPGADPDVGLDLSFWPTARDITDPSTWTGAPWADAPLMAYVQYRGDLKLERSQNVNTLDLTNLVDDGIGVLRPGDEFTNGNVTVRIPELRRWVGLQFSHRPTAPILLAGAALILLGLLPALYAFRRRLWVEATADPVTGATLVTIAGRAFQRPQAFDEEFASLAAQLHKMHEASPDPDRIHL